MPAWHSSNRQEIATVTSFPRNDRLFRRGDQKVNCPKGQEKPPWGASRLLGPLFEGAGCEADWGSVIYYEGHSLRHGFRRATSLREGGKGMFHPAGDGPWAPLHKEHTIL